MIRCDGFTKSDMMIDGIVCTLSALAESGNIFAKMVISDAKACEVAARILDGCADNTDA